MKAQFFLACLCCLLFSFSSQASQRLTVIVSPGHAAMVAGAIEQIQARHSDLVFQARTSEQILKLSPSSLRSLLEGSDFILGAGLFGPVVSKIKDQLPKHIPKLFFSSDHQLIIKSQLSRFALFPSLTQVSALSAENPKRGFNSWLKQVIEQHPNQKPWLEARAYWQAGGLENITELLTWSASNIQNGIAIKAPIAQQRVRWIINGKLQNTLPVIKGDEKSTLLILDNNRGDRPADKKVSQAICLEARSQKLNCVTALSYWGEPAYNAVKSLMPFKQKIAGIVMLQDFVVGGGEHREASTELFKELNVPIMKAIKSTDRSAFQRAISMDGIAAEKVYYQVAMPELQGVSQPLVVATLGDNTQHELSGIQLSALNVSHNSIKLLIDRLSRWHTLQTLENKNKKIAIVYYNHPPGRHNIGADNLDVPASLWTILNNLKSEGYYLGELPKDQNALLDLLQEKGVNLPNNSDALEKMAPKINRMNKSDYEKHFQSLPDSIQYEMSKGPLGYLHQELKQSVDKKQFEYALKKLEHSVEEIHHLLEGIDHPARNRAVELLDGLEHCYQVAIKQQQNCWSKAQGYIDALVKTGIEGLRGWGEVPGKVMVKNDELLIPGIQFGHVFIGPQPPRGWEIDEELLHANLAFPPPHQYLAFYHFLRNGFSADAIIHLGRHSTYEFLPRRSVGVMEDDYSRVIAADVPGLYPYIVDGVGEGIQAKRRGLAVMIDHLTPPLASTPLYDELLKLRQLVESFEANHDSDNTALKIKLVNKIREKVEKLELKEEMAQAIAGELKIMGISFDELDDDMLVHEVGHYLTDLQERFMPLGLHVFSKPWEKNAVEMMLDSMAPENKEQKNSWNRLLTNSPQAEIDALLNGLNGGFISPGAGNDPIRTADSLPTGRNFYALDSSLIPSPTAWDLGAKMAQDARAKNAQSKDKSEAIVLWASDVVRDEGVMIAFGLDMLGVEPVWNSRGLVKSLKLQALTDIKVRRNTVFTSSGLFRDLYAKQMLLINEAVLMAVAASGNTIIEKYPALTLSLDTALSSLKTPVLGSEPLNKNQVAGHWVTQANKLLEKGFDQKQVAAMASMRVFGAGPGSYGAGINRLVERSGSWQARSEVARVYMNRMGHSYTLDSYGIAMQKVFKNSLATVENSYLGRSSNLYGLMDNNDAFDYFGGLSLAVETLTGNAPNNFVINHANTDRIVTQPLNTALKQELRGRFLNPEWLKGLMKHDYAGARTMGSEFLEYLWGWQVTNPTLVGDWVWQEVKDVYLNDRYQLGLDEFLLEGHNVHVKSNMLAIMLVAIQKGFWQANVQTQKELAQEFAEIVKEHGLPGSGHTSPDHPMLPWLKDKLNEQQWAVIENLIEDKVNAENEIHTLSEISLDNVSAEPVHGADKQKNSSQDSQDNKSSDDNKTWLTAVLWIMLILFFASFIRTHIRLRKS